MSNILPEPLSFQYFLTNDLAYAVRPSPQGTGGRIIFVSATLHYTGAPFQTHVAVAKAGVDALSNNVSLEFGPLGVTSNIIAPGPIANTEV
jgi:peroxisomal 2,4-dienoyl-CoA reductase